MAPATRRSGRAAACSASASVRPAASLPACSPSGCCTRAAKATPTTASTSPGFFDAPQGGGAAIDLGNRPIDFGTGGDDWDSGSSDVGGSDGGGGGDGGGWD